MKFERAVFTSSFIVPTSSFPQMINIPTIPFIAKRRKPPAPPALTLRQATYPVEGVTGAIDLKFDRAIDISALDKTQIIVKDGVILGTVNDIEFAELLDEQTARMYFQELGEYSEPNQLLGASATTGIVAVEDGGTWAGVTELALPWPPPVPGHIVSVTHGIDGFAIRVGLDEALQSYDDVMQMLGVSSNGVTWRAPYALNNEDPTNLVFFFSDDVSAATQWRVLHPENWHFGGGEVLGEPMSGAIE
jgi:hypothetical protein